MLTVPEYSSASRANGGAEPYFRSPRFSQTFVPLIFYSIWGFGATPPPAAVAVRRVGVFMLSR